jgi:hypothetical protein
MGFDDPFVVALPQRLRAKGLMVDEGLVPTMLIRYERRRWIEPSSNARVSLDTDISCPVAAGGIALHVPGSLHLAVVEAKGQFDSLPVPLRTITAVGGRRTSFSKYWACFQHGRRIAL